MPDELRDGPQGEQFDRAAVVALLDALGDRSWGVRTAALRALVRLDLSPDLWPEIGHSVLQALSPSVERGAVGADRLEVIEAAARVPVQPVRERLRQLLGSDSEEQKRVAMKALATLRDSSVAREVVARLAGGEVGIGTDEEWRVRWSRQEAWAEELDYHVTYLLDMEVWPQEYRHLGLPEGRENLASLRPVDVGSLASSLFGTLIRKLDVSVEDPFESILGGNAIVALVSLFGPRIAPDVTALFDSYLGAFDRYVILDDRWPTLRWQIAWTASRAPLRAILAESARRLSAVDERTRVAAARFVEEAARYRTQMWGPAFGGGSEPPDFEHETSELMELVGPEVGVAALGHGPERTGQPTGASEVPAGAKAAFAGGAPPEPPVYPSIDPEPEHVVVGRKFRVTASLQVAPSSATTGKVQPPSPGPHTFDVHLLLGDQSAWDTLTWSREAGTTKTAAFEFAAPLVPPRDDGTVPERMIATLTANFYLNGRWCGEGRRNMEILLNDAVVPSVAIVPPLTARWLAMLNLAPGAEPADLLVRIQNVGGDLYEWSLFSPHLDLRSRPGEVPERTALKNGPQRFVRTNFDRIAGERLDERTIPVIEARCREIYASAADSFKRAYWQLYFAAKEAEQLPASGEGAAGRLPRLESIQFISDEPYVPWELMLVRDDQHAPGVKEEILSIRHAVGRWVAKASGRLQPSIEVREIAVFASDYARVEGVEPKLPWAVEEQNLLVGRYGAQPGVLKFEPVMEFFKHGSAQAVHFSCHGSMNVELPAESTLRLEDFPEFFTAYVAQDDVRDGEGSQHPLVFLNACQLGGAGAQLGLVTGWPQTFLEAGASACIAPLWSVIDANAKEAAAMFYKLVFEEHKTLGQALQQIRREWRDRRSLTFLSYVLYGDPTAQVRWQRPPASDQVAALPG